MSLNIISRTLNHKTAPNLFLMLMIGLQNNERKSRVNFLVDETVQLPIGFTMGISFIMGSLIGNLIPITYNSKK